MVEVVEVVEEVLRCGGVEVETILPVGLPD